MSNIQDPEAFALLNQGGTETGWETKGEPTNISAMIQPLP